MIFFFFGQSPSKSISKNHHHWPQLKLNRISPVFSSLATKCVALFLRLCSLLCGYWNSVWLIIKIRHALHNTDFTVMCRCTYIGELYDIVQCVSASIKRTFYCYSCGVRLLSDMTQCRIPIPDTRCVWLLFIASEFRRWKVVCFIPAFFTWFCTCVQFRMAIVCKGSSYV